jgi:GAF domain-containing protein
VRGLENRAEAGILRFVGVGIDEAIERIGAETAVSQLLGVACRELATLTDAERVSVSRVIGDLLVELAHYERAGRELPLELYLVSDYPLTKEVLERGEPRAAARTDPAADEAETALLERLGYDALLMHPLRSAGRNWGLIEIYAGSGIVFRDDVQERSAAIVAALERQLEVVERPA